jgi:nitroreductase
VQTYLYIKPDRVEGFSERIYYYNPRSHQLVAISDHARLDRSCHRTHNRPVFDESAFSLFFIGQLSVISSMYGELSRDFCMVEAGYMSQLLMTAAPMHHIGFCPVGEVDYASIRDLFSLEESHVFLHSLLCGRVDPILATGWSFLSENSGETTPLWSVQPQAPRTSAVTVAALDSFLKEKLPKYMIPSTITVLDSLPLTANGKVDRKNLPAPEIISNKLVETYVAPKSEMEQTIAAVWQEMLPVEKVGIHDNFFDLSGNSLLMVQTYTKLREILGRDISLVEMFFQYATIHSLAEFLTQGQHTQSALEESLDQRYDRIESHKESMQEQRQARLKHRAAERSEDE